MNKFSNTLWRVNSRILKVQARILNCMFVIILGNFNSNFKKSILWSVYANH